MTPVMGQGLNCGLEDVAVFANMLQQHKGNVATTLPAYSKARGPDVEGILSVNELMTDRSIFVPIQVCLSGLNAEAYTHAHVGLLVACTIPYSDNGYCLSWLGVVVAQTPTCQAFMLRLNHTYVMHKMDTVESSSVSNWLYAVGFAKPACLHYIALQATL